MITDQIKFSSRLSLSDIHGNKVLNKVKDVIQEKQRCFIVDGKSAIAVIVPSTDYNRYEEMAEDYELLTIAVSRMQNADLSKTIPHEEVLRELGITEKDLENIEVDIE